MSTTSTWTVTGMTCPSGVCIWRRVPRSSGILSGMPSRGTACRIAGLIGP